MNKVTALWTLMALAAGSFSQTGQGTAAELALAQLQSADEGPLIFLDAEGGNNSFYMAAHHSHRSHRSHRSHYSSRGGYSAPSYRRPAYSAPSAAPHSTSSWSSPRSTQTVQDDVTYSTTLVKSIQTGLKKLGFYSGKIDGLYGPGTRKGIVAFEIEQGLSQTGIPSIVLDEQIKAVLAR